MNGPLLRETILDLVLAQARTNLNPILETVDYQYSDGISLEPIAPNNYYLSPIVESLTMPSCYIMLGPTEFQYDDNQNYLYGTTETVVVISSEEVGADNLIRKAMRYERVLMSLFNLVDLKSTDGRVLLRCIPTRTGSTAPSQVKQKLPSQEAKYRADTVLEMSIKHYELNETDI